MDPKGANLASTDLLEIAQLVSGSYVTKSITGAEIISGATTGFVPTSRTLTINGTTQDLSADRTFTISTGITIGTTAITSGTVGRVLFEGTGNVVQQSANLFWDNTNGRLGIGGTPGAFNLDIFGTSRLQGRITTTYSSTTTSGIVGAIGSGTDLFGLSHAAEGFVLWLTSGFTSPNNYASGFGLGLGNPTSSNIKFLASNLTITATNITMPSNNITLGFGGANQHLIYSSTSPFVGFKYTNTGGWNFDLREESTGTQRFVIFGATGNVGLSTTTNAGFKLDVNGTARVSGQFDVISGTANFRVNNNSTYVQLGIGSTAWIQYNATETYLQSTNIFFQNASSILYASGRGIFGSSSLNNSAQFQVDSTTRGFLPPRMTTTQKNAIASPATGLVVYDTTLNKLCVRTASAWETITSL